ncbi:MAG TPA: hypothetical protein VGH38_26325, partial [Bryobacteraceae bacterium]
MGTVRDISAFANRALAGVPASVRPYLIPLGGLVCLTATIDLLLHIIGIKVATYGSLLLILYVMCAAWSGYGPGLLTCALA